jgi:tetratricopeptide (TPR) repeat protein
VELEPDNIGGWNNLGICYNRLDQLDRAIWAFENVIKRNPEWPPVYLNLALVHEKRQDLAAASRALERAVLIATDAERIDIYDKLARSYFMQKKYGLALKTLEKAIELVSNDPKLLDYLQSRRELVLRAAAGAEEADPVGTQP